MMPTCCKWVKVDTKRFDQEIIMRKQVQTLTDLPEYNLWRKVTAKCRSDKTGFYTIDDRWVSDFLSFYRDMGTRPGPHCRLVRIDSSKPYCKENCRWIDLDKVVHAPLSDRQAVELPEALHALVLRTVKDWDRRSPEYQVWANLIQRCNNPKNPMYPKYGGRGITVCARWLNSFDNFFSDMGHRPGPEYSLDRKDNDLGYYKGNCRWATAQEQSVNRSVTRWVMYKGERMHLSELSRRTGLSVQLLRIRLNRYTDMEDVVRKPIEDYVFRGESRTLREWSGHLGISYHTLYARLEAGWSVEEAFTTPAPVRKHFRLKPDKS
jgi:hypothetical protein